MSSSLQRLKSRLQGSIFGASNKAAAITKPNISRGSQSLSDTSHLSLEESRFDYGVYQYPEDLGNNDHGHYILFHIYERNTSKYINPTKSAYAEGTANLSDVSFNTNLSGNQGQKFDGVSRSSSVGSKGIKEEFKPLTRENGEAGREGYTTSYNLRQAGRFVKSKDTIALYMPPGIETSYKMNYKSDETGLGGVLMQTAGVVGEGQSLSDYITSQANVSNLNTLASSLGELMGAKGVLKISSYLGAGDPAGQLNKMLNEAPNPALEAIFSNVGFREFSYNFRMTPKSEREVRVVDDIVRLFKFHASPERMFGEKVGRHFRMPAEFDIFYMYQGTQNTWYPMIHSCVCTSVDVKYGPSGEPQHFRTVDGSPAPTETNLTLNFRETEVITKELVKQGF